MKITDAQLDTLKELINIGVGRAAGVLHDMLDSHVHLQVPSLKVINDPHSHKDIEKIGTEQLSSVKLDFSGSLAGSALLTFPSDSAAKLVEVLTGEDTESPDMDSLRIGALGEVGNIVINGIMGSIGNMLKLPIDYSIPFYLESSFENIINRNATLILAQIRFDVQQFQIQGDIFLLFEVESFKKLKSAIDLINEDTGVEL